mmetsp:Transcript_27802/g.50515  ORF Transcript_27802/g.50515 Transcript_27802/m.50515 type:complete len:107 (-) Transcript_27802:3902-4222(-)
MVWNIISKAHDVVPGDTQHLYIGERTVRLNKWKNDNNKDNNTNMKTIAITVTALLMVKAPQYSILISTPKIPDSSTTFHIYERDITLVTDKHSFHLSKSAASILVN